MIKEAIAAAAQGGTLTINGYRTSKGAVINYVVKLLPPGGYQDLVRESLVALKEGKAVRPENISQEDWDQAVLEKIASWETTLAGKTAPRNFSRVLVEHEGYSSYQDDPDTLILRNLVKVSEEIVDPGEIKAVKSAAKTLAKAAIDKQLPVGQYLGQLNLAPG